MNMNILVTVMVVLYLLIMLFIGWYSSTKITSNTDFVVAGRRLGQLLMAGTLAATEIGGGSSLGVVQNGMQNHGLSVSWYIITMGIAFVILSFLAPKFRGATVKTVPEYFRRYGKASGLITAIIMFLPLVGLTAGQFIASAVILSTMLGISYKTAVIIVAIVVTVYSIMGGLWSVTLTDFIQVFLIVIGMIIAVPFALKYAGGWGNVVANVPEGTKITMCVVGIASMLIALFNTQSLITILMFCFTLRAAGSFFPYVLGHYWGKASTAGTIASLIAGTVVVVYLDKFSGGNLFGIHFSQTIVPGLVAALIFFLIFSFIFPSKKDSTELAPDED